MINRGYAIFDQFRLRPTLCRCLHPFRSFLYAIEGPVFFFYLMYFFFFSIVGDCSYQKVYVSNQRRRETPKNLKVNDFLEMITVNTAQH